MRSGAIACCLVAAAGQAHPERLAQIDEIRNTPGVLWRAELHPRFASEAPGASKALCGVKGDWQEEVEEMIRQGEVEPYVNNDLADEDIPSEFDSATHWPQCAKTIGDIRDQSNCGCCWAFAGTEAASDRMCIATNGSIQLPLSAQNVCFCASLLGGCNGGQVGPPWRYIRDHGAVTGNQYNNTGPFGDQSLCSAFSLPHCHHHGPQRDDPYPAEGKPGCPSASSPRCPKACDAGAKAPHDDFNSDKYTFQGRLLTAGFLRGGVAGVQKLIMAGGPVATAFMVFSDFENYAGGIYHHVSGLPSGGHAVKIVGWGAENGTKYWKVANSWNPYWGENGYFRIKFGTGGIDLSVMGSAPDAKWGKKTELDSEIVV